MTFTALDHKETCFGKNVKGHISFPLESFSSLALEISHCVITLDYFFFFICYWFYSTLSLLISKVGSGLSYSNLIIISAFSIHDNATIYFSDFINSPFVSLFLNIFVF